MNFFIQLMLFLACITLQANASETKEPPSQPSLAYWRDPSNTVTINELSSEAFQPFHGLLHKGYTPDSLWIKGDSSAWQQGNPEDILIIRVRPSFLDHVTLYIPRTDGHYTSQESGDMTPWRGASYPSLNLGFKIKRSELAKNFYLHVQTTSTLIVSVEMMNESDASHSDEKQKVWYTLTLSMIAMFWCWIFVSWLQHRDRLRLVFAIKQLCSLFYTLGFFGYYRVLLSDVASPEQINLLFNVTVTVVTTSAFWYEFNFVSQYKLIPWVKTILHSTFVMPSISVVLISLGYAQQGLHLNMLFVGTATLMLFINCFTLNVSAPTTSHTEQPPYLFSRPILIAYYGVLCIALMVNVVAAMGLNIGLEFELHNFVLHGIISGFMMTLLLQIRAYKMEQSVREKSNALYLTEKQLVLDQAKRDEQLQFLHMLTHELKTPLSVIDLVLKSSAPNQKTIGYANRAVADMKSIIERCVDVDRLDEGNIETTFTTFNIKALILNILQASPLTEHRINVDIADDLCIQSDPQYVRTILGNLIENAMRYGSPIHPIHITTHVESDETSERLGICIANTPATAGWPDSAQVFNKYYRNPKTLNISGTGLGLFLVSRLATILGGRCVYAPTIDQVRFILWIPN